MDRKQDKTDKPFDMAQFVAELTDDPTMADSYREYERTVRLRNELVDKRVRRGLTQRDMAKLMGVNQSRVCRFEDKPDDDLDLGTLRRYAAALGFHMTLHFADEKQTDASRIKDCVFSIQRQLQNITDIARKHPDDKDLCNGIAQFQAEVLLNFLVKYGESADLPRVFDFIAEQSDSPTATAEPKQASGKVAAVN